VTVRVLLIATNREARPSYAVPAGVAYLQNALLEAGHQAQIVDLCFEPDERLEAVVTKEMTDFQPDLVGVSIRNVDNETYLRYRGNLGDVRIAIEACRASSDAPIVLGGSAFSLMPVEIMKLLGVDLGVVGEGEPAIVAIADAMRDGRVLDCAPGLVRLVGGEVVSSEPARVADPASIRAPRTFRPDPRYFSNAVVGPQPTYGIQTKRGCTFRCSYCPVPSIEGKRFRLRAPDEIVDEMRHVRDLAGVHRFFITDSIFNLPKRHAIAVCRALVDSRLGVTWMAYTNPLQYDQELTDLFREAGCETLNFGLDAGCEGLCAKRHRARHPLRARVGRENRPLITARRARRDGGHGRRDTGHDGRMSAAHPHHRVRHTAVSADPAVAQPRRRQRRCQHATAAVLRR
jgi:radical SAM superfamily enzyme YgiQ (UPF0313 family)